MATSNETYERLIALMNKKSVRACESRLLVEFTTQLPDEEIPGKAISDFWTVMDEPGETEGDYCRMYIDLKEGIDYSQNLGDIVDEALYDVKEMEKPADISEDEIDNMRLLRIIEIIEEVAADR